MNKLTVLVLDDEKRFTEELTEFLENSGFQTFEANSAAQGLSLLKKQSIDLLILDVRLPGVNGLDILKKVKVKYPNMEVIIVSAHGDMDTVIKAMRSGAIDYLRKPFRHIDIRIAIERTEKFLFLQRKVKQMEEKNSLISKNLEDRIERHFIGISPQIKEVLDMAMTASKFPDTNVLITGESGTGKENIARIIHFASKRKDNMFCAVNSSAVTDSLMESEFFGHKKGSFTGALTDKKGFFETSDEGTLFLDEIADMPMNLQATMLRAIEEKKITRVGETQPIATDFRIISATNHILDDLVEEKRFRLDLVHRLNTLHIHLPTLRERPEDIKPLLLYFAEDFSRKLNKPSPIIDEEVFQTLKSYPFPGNVRELKNITERAIILSKGNTLGAKDFPVKIKIKSTQPEKGTNLNLEKNEAKLIQLALNNCNNNQIAAANALGIQRMALARKIQKYKISLTNKEGQK
ncbi:regulator protein pilR [Polaribacter irgensii 23-P]|uniref:Regulator protein pilR n=1 Tax=Polaribacter irgensii 23-P TaxID=313594 RepID=A4BWF3_9FLAO|nr:sigma-54 dependent transcriptional regulator [Polaribacter irgensii]EAR13294.1 regulator protein pilR [Polaribacter irgensii 23-P]